MPESDQKMVSGLPRQQRCAAQHFGPWMVEPQWMAQAIAAVKAGTFTPHAADAADGSQDDPGVVGEICGDVFKVRYYLDGGIARIPFSGQVTKGVSSFGGASSVWTRQSVRLAVNDDRVSAILLQIDSPGGTVAGTGDLADDIYKAGQVKPVYAYFEDLGASAAYWIGSQARRIFANPTAMIGSIGTMTYVEDTSGMYEKAGIKMHLVSTGQFKGAWLDGLPIDEAYLAEVQTEVNDLNEHFLAGVLRGRPNLTREKLNEVADGRVFIASKAKDLGLIDEVASIDAVMQAIEQEIQSMNSEQFNAYTAEHPEAVASFVEKGKKAGIAEAHQAEIDRMAAIEAACPGRPQVAIDAFKAGHDAEQVKLTISALDRELAAAKAADEANAKAMAVKDAEIEKLKAQIGERPAVATGAQQHADPVSVDPESDDPKAVAAAEWKANKDGCQSSFTSEAAYVGYRVADLQGRVKHKAK